MKTITKLWLIIVVLIVLSPLGIMLPRYFKSGTAWEEGMGKLSSLWNAPMPGYAKNGGGYIISALLGIAVVAGVVFLAGMVLKKRDR